MERAGFLIAELKHAEDVSLWMLVFTLGSGLLYEVYAWHLGLTPVLVMNGIFVLMVITEICLKIKYDRRKRRRSQ